MIESLENDFRCSAVSRIFEVANYAQRAEGASRVTVFTLITLVAASARGSSLSNNNKQLARTRNLKTIIETEYAFAHCRQRIVLLAHCDRPVHETEARCDRTA